MISREIVGSKPRKAQTNVFYKGIPEFVVHSREVDVPSSSVAELHTYEIDWRSDRLTWSIDGRTVRSLNRDDSTSPMTPPGERWFPSTPSHVQIAVWDGGASENQGTSQWAGGPIPWGNNQNHSAIFEYIDIQCYNDQNQPVPNMPSVNEVRQPEKFGLKSLMSKTRLHRHRIH